MIEVKSEKEIKKAPDEKKSDDSLDKETISDDALKEEAKSPQASDVKDKDEKSDTGDVEDNNKDGDKEASEDEGKDDNKTDKKGKESDKKSSVKPRKKKDKRDDQIAELKDKLLRNLAEFENFRNRSDKEKSERFDMGAKSVIEKLLPVVDNLERGFEGLDDGQKDEPFVKGIEAVYKQLMTTLTELGVTPIEAVGQDFDPNIHNAVMHDEDDSDVTNKVVEELQKGYMFKESLVRPSMVKVLN